MVSSDFPGLSALTGAGTGFILRLLDLVTPQVAGTGCLGEWEYEFVKGATAMFGSIGMPELIIILVIALIIFGPRKLPELGKSLGRSINEFKRASADLQNTLEQEIKLEEQKEQKEQPAKQGEQSRFSPPPDHFASPSTADGEPVARGADARQ